MTAKIELGKRYRTLDRCETRIYSLDGSGDFPVHGAIYRNGFWELACWTEYGSWSAVSNNDNLIEVRPRIKREVWMNVYENSTSTGYCSKDRADSAAVFNRLACIKITIDCEEGEGL